VENDVAGIIFQALPASDMHTPPCPAFAHHPHPDVSVQSPQDECPEQVPAAGQAPFVHVLCAKPLTSATSLAPQKPSLPPLVHHEHLLAASEHASQVGRQPQSSSRPQVQRRKLKLKANVESSL